MAEQEIGSYLVFYAVICVCLGASYMKVKSAEGVTVTTKEFKTFQNGFLTAHGMIFLGDLLCLASFYPTFASIGCNIEQITKLYITTTISKTVFGLLTDIIDFGTRKDKCVLSAALYSFSLFLLFCDDHFDMLIMSRVVYGAGSALHHTAFENYINYQHEILGFPDDWLHFTYNVMTHGMALTAGLSGMIGQTASSSGSLGTVSLCCLLFVITAIYIGIVWDQDMSSPRFMWGGFLFNVKQAIETAKSKKKMQYILGIAIAFESAITIFTFYWAPWLASTVSNSVFSMEEEVEDPAAVPFETIYATMVAATLLGNYLFGLYAAAVGPELTFQIVLLGSSAVFLVSCTFFSPMFVVVASVVLQLLVGGYWPSIGSLRGRYIVPEQISACLNIIRIGTLALSCTVLYMLHDSPFLILASCSMLCGAAAYMQHAMSALHLTDGEDFDEYEKDDV